MKPATAISYSRIALAISLIPVALQGNKAMFSIIYILAVATDIADGYVARRLRQESESGKRLDIIADNILLAAVAVSYLFLRKEIVASYMWNIIFLTSYYLLVQGISILVYREAIFKRTLAANLAAAVFPAIVISSLYFDLSTLIYLYIFLMYYSLTEKVMMKLQKKSFLIPLALIIMLSFAGIYYLTKDRVCFTDGYCIAAEVKDSPEERALGLMFRESLAEDKGMLFIFEEPSVYSFWMKNMRISIDMIFLDKDKRIVHIAQDVPPCNQDPCPTYSPDKEAQYVVEVKANFSSLHHLEEGQKVSFRDW